MSGPRDNGYHKNSADSRVFGALRRVRRSVRNKAYVFSNGVLGQFNGLRKGSLRVALVSSRKWKGKVYDDLLLQRALVKVGAKVEIVAFEDLSVDYAKYDRVVVRAMWGYQNDLKALSDWMERVKKSGVKIYNDLGIIQGNFDKEKQFDGLKGLPVVPTEFIEIGGFEKIESFGDLKVIVGKIRGRFNLDFPFVVKPTISASGENTFLIKSEEEFLELLPKVVRVNAKKKMMLQPFIAEISGGEIGVVVISGEICHVVRRFPGVLSGGGYRVELVAREIDGELKDLCAKVVAKYPGALYLRIDAVKRGDKYLIMEVEAFEPELFFRLLKGEERKNALEKMASAILR